MVVCGVSILVMGILALHVNKRKAAVGSCAPLSVSEAKLTQLRRSCRTESLSFLLPTLPSFPARLKWLRAPTGLDRPCCPLSYPRRHCRCSLLGPPYEWHRIHSGVQQTPLSPPRLAPAIYHALANFIHRSSKMGRWHPSSCVDHLLVHPRVFQVLMKPRSIAALWYRCRLLCGDHLHQPRHGLFVHQCVQVRSTRGNQEHRPLRLDQCMARRVSFCLWELIKLALTPHFNMVL